MSKNVSILIPLRNTNPRWIQECIESIESQTYPHFEIIIINDKSENKATLSALKEIEKKKNIDCKVFHSQIHQGVGGSLNLGLSKCKNNLIARMDSDDVMLPKRLEVQVNYMKAHPEVDILGGQLVKFNSNLTQKIGKPTTHPLQVNKRSPLKSHWFLNHPTVMYKKNRILKIGGYGNLKGYSEDFHLWLRCLEKEYIIHNLPNTVLKYRGSSAQVTASGFNANNTKYWKGLLEQYKKRLKL